MHNRKQGVPAADAVRLFALRSRRGRRRALTDNGFGARERAGRIEQQGKLTHRAPALPACFKKDPDIGLADGASRRQYHPIIPHLDREIPGNGTTIESGTSVGLFRRLPDPERVPDRCSTPQRHFRPQWLVQKGLQVHLSKADRVRGRRSDQENEQKPNP